MKKLICAATLFASVAVSHATLSVGPWTPIFKGVDHAVGTNYPDATIPRLQVANCVRVDLTDPDVQLFTTPKAPNLGFCGAGPGETRSLSISNFIRSYGVQVAADANFYTVCPGGTDPVSEGLPSDNEGLLISTGQVVSVADNARYVSLMFTTNKAPILVLNNRSPG